MTDELIREEKWFAGFLNDLELERSWGATDTLIARRGLCRKTAEEIRRNSKVTY